MLKITKKLVHKNGYNNFELKEANSRNLPFKDNFFDVLYNAYMLDLITLQDMSSVLNEFKRVLKPGGRLVLLNMSKPDETKSLHEKLYQLLPSKLVLYLAGGCRPVLMENSVNDSGFQNVSRSFLSGRNPSEIVVAVKPIMTITSKN
jgi:demethylmenaquinone methyltransferase/2-methoxy-6-polyprenyl-1,4-benzoquinol methylase